MPGRTFNGGSYRYGMNGQENDNEITGIFGTHTSAEYWEYDTRSGRRWNTDPVVKPWESVYATFGNNPTVYADPNGLDKEDKILHDLDTGTEKYVEGANGKDYITHEYGRYDRDTKGGFRTYWSRTDEREKELSQPIRTFEPTAHQKAIYGACDDFSKGFCVGAVAGASAFVGGAAMPALASEASMIGEFGLPVLKATLASGAGGGTYALFSNSFGGAYLEGAFLKGGTDALVQTFVNGAENIDVLDVGYSAFLTPFGSALMGSLTDYKPMSGDQNFKSVLLSNKGLNVTMADFSAKLTFSSIGAFKRVNDLAKTGFDNAYPYVLLPINGTGKMTGNKLKEIFK